MLYKLILALPLIGALAAGLGGRMLGAKSSELLTSGLMIVAALLSWIAFFQVGFGGADTTGTRTIFTWMVSGELAVDWAIRVDTLTVVMLVVVNTVSALVHVYSIGYMHEDPSRPRFFAYLSLFTFAMLMLVTADNFAQLFFGWEGVGLASYLLIGFWYHKPEANAAAIKAFVVNRVGDFGFALGIFGVFFVFGTVDFTAVFNAVPDQSGKMMNFLGYQLPVMEVLCALLFIGAMGKSAQLFLHTWLPDAMEGPTPVSALIHAATMVTAGVFMVARLSPMFEAAPNVLWFVTLIGASTAFFAATIGLVQNDIKRVIAYSTCSQLGYMFAALGVGAYSAGIFHLFTHAFFKALLFLGAGSVIHAMHHEQDMRNMGGLAPKIRMTWVMMLIGTLALTGFPFITAGFYSKDAIIEAAFAAQSGIGQYAFWMLVVAAFMTSFYSWRLIFMTFHGKSRAEPETLKHAHESPMVMLVPLFVLAAGAIASGFLFKSYFIGDGYGDFWKQALFIGEGNTVLQDLRDVPAWVVWSATVMMVAGFVLSYFMYIVAPGTPAIVAKIFKPIYLLFYNKWYFDEIYDWLFVKPAFWIGRMFWKTGDQRIIDGIGPNGIAARVLDVTSQVVKLQSGFVYHYAFAMLIGLAALVTYFMFGATGGGLSGLIGGAK